jgi:hypothetical protein
MKLIYLSFILLILGCTSLPPKCGITNCHGLDISCGPNIPKSCAEIYQLGDFCRAYAECSIISNSCQLNASEKFYECKSCIETCEELYDGSEAFDCEAACRDKMDKYCNEDRDCGCGRNINTNDCFYGSKELVNANEQCPDYCAGIAGNLEIKCINHECSQINKLNS